MLVDLDLAAEDPVNADRIRQDNGHADQGNDEHDPQGFLGGTRIVNRQAILRVRIRQGQIGKDPQAKEKHEKNNSSARRKEGKEIPSLRNAARDIGNSQKLDHRNQEKKRV